MERAGTAAYGVICRRWPRISSLNVVCGPGNNGGDGYILARLAHHEGIKVTVSQVESPKTDDAQHAFDQLSLQGIIVEPLNSEIIGEADLIVDAVLGTGLSRPPINLFKNTLCLVLRFSTRSSEQLICICLYMNRVCLFTFLSDIYKSVYYILWNFCIFITNQLCAGGIDRQ